MKRFISLAAAAAMIFGAASCQKELATQKGDCKVSFSVEVPNDVATKADMSDGTTVDQLICEAWVGSERKYRYEIDIEQKGSRRWVVDLDLVTNITYDILFWAQKKGAGYYDTNINGNSGLKCVRVSYGKHYSNVEARDAFYGSVLGFTPTNIAQEKKVSLVRPFAQINFGSSEKDWEKAKPFITNEGLKSRVEFKKVPREFNVFTGDVISGSETDLTFDYALSPASEKFDGKNDYYNDDWITYNNAKYAWIAMNYVFAPKEQSVINSVTGRFIHEMNANDPLSKEVFNVPFMQNHRTNILGELFTGGNKFIVEIKPSFANEEYTVSDPLYFAFETGSAFTLGKNLEIGSGLVLSGNKELVVDLNGYKITVDAKKTIWNQANGEWSIMSVQDGAKLTIIDSKGTGSIVEKDGDSYVFDVRGEGSVLNIEGGNFVGNISSVYVVDGTANIKGGNFSI
jgi:hypothetical protein